jgi:hypothetical protein
MQSIYLSIHPDHWWAPPAGRGYSSTTNRKLNQHGSVIKLKNAVLTQVCRDVSITQ